MARAIWKGHISFGLVNIPVSLFSAEKSSKQVAMHLLDKKTHSRIHNQRVNEKGSPVAWENIEHAYEFEKGKYVVVDQKMLEKTASSNYETVEILSFVPLDQIDPIYFEKPYYLLPGEAGNKGYVLLHDILQRSRKVGIANVVIKTKEHLAAILPQNGILTLITLRYAKEIYVTNEIADNEIKELSKIKLQPREIKLAEELVQKMSTKWQPKDFRNNNKELLLKLIQGSIKQGKTITSKSKTTKTQTSSGHKGEKVLDFMEILKRSVADKEKDDNKHSRRK